MAKQKNWNILQFFILISMIFIPIWYGMKFFKLQNIKINHLEKNQLNELDLDDYFSSLYQKNNLFINPWSIKKILQDVDLIENVMVDKKYPNEINISFNFKQPIIFFQQNGQGYIIDQNMQINKVSEKTIEKHNNFKHLIYLEIQEENPGYILQLIKNFTDVKDFNKRFSSIYQINNRRWDIIVDRRIKVMLPENINKEFIEKTLNLIDGLKSKNDIALDALYVILDLRIKDKVFIKNIKDEV